jgi:hypothetical protein
MHMEPVESVKSADYFRRVLSNMGKPSDGNRVRFGLTGDGVRPNYQIEFANEGPVAYASINHKRDASVVTYDDAELGRARTYEEVQTLLAGCGGRDR